MDRGRLSRFRFFLGCALIGAVAQAHAIEDPTGWLRKMVFDRIQIDGYRLLGYHNHSVQGDREAFNALSYYGQGDRAFTDTGNLYLNGRNVFGLLNFSMVVPDSRFRDPESQHISLNYRGDGLRVDVGDLTEMGYGGSGLTLPGGIPMDTMLRATRANLSSPIKTNPYANIGRQLKGVSVEYGKGRLSAAALWSESKGSVKTISFAGNNSPGPYYIQNGRLVSGSEAVQVDGKDQLLNQDYVIDYEVGAITFTRILAPTQTAVIAYEAYDFNTQNGTIQGAGVGYDAGRFGRIAVNYLTQKSPGAGGISSRIEQFEGFGAASTPYFLQYVPLSTATYPTIIKIDSLLQVEGVDYHFDTGNPTVFYIHRFVPATSIVEATYYPKPSTTLDGDREVIGLEYRLPLGKSSYLLYHQGQGKLKNPVTPLAGTARSLMGSYNHGGLNVRAGIRDIPDSFVTLDSRSFNRNEKAYNLNADYQTRGFRYTGSHRSAKVSLRQVSSTGAITFQPSDQATTAFGLEYAKGDGLRWDASARRDTSARTGYDSRLDVLTAGLSRTTGPLETRIGVSRQSGDVSDSAGSRAIGLNALELNAKFRPDKRWTWEARTALTQTSYAGDSGSGRDLTLLASYRPNDDLTLSASWLDSKAGALSALSGFSSGYGEGYDGNGFSGGLGATYGSGGADYRALRFGATYRPSTKLTLDARLEKSNTSGAFSTNTNSTVGSISGFLDLGNQHRASFTVSRSDISFLGSSLSSNSTFLEGMLTGDPPGPWSYRLSGSALTAGGGDFSQSSLRGDANLSYRLNRKSYLGVRGTLGRSNGYLPQDESLLSLFYEHQIYGNVSLIGSYKIRELIYRDPLASSPGYTSRGFDLELSFRFGG